MPIATGALAADPPASLDSALFEGSPDCVKLIDAAGCLLAMNRNGRRAMEIGDVSALIGQPWSSLWPAASHALVEQALATAATGQAGHFTAFCPSASGKPIWWDVVVTPLLRRDGSLHCYMSVSRDVTALRDARERFSLIVSQAATGVVEAGRDGTIRFANATFCAMLGYTEPELIGMPVLAITAPDCAAGTALAISDLLAGGRPLMLEKRYLRKDGTPLWAASSVNALRGADGGIESIVAVIVDITERKAAEQRLREEDQRKDEFLAMLAHELRNPLAPILSAAEYLGAASLPPAAVQRAAAIVLRQVRHMTALVDDLLDVSRVTRGLAELHKEQLDLAGVVHDALEQAAPLMQARGHALSVQLPPAPALALGERKRLVQVLANLLNNAAKYTDPGGCIGLRCSAQAGAWELAVSDNGQGMDAALAARVFELFTQARRSADRSSGGLGLGLPLARRLAELHGGSVECASAGPGMGSTFTLRLPQLVQAQAA